MLTGAIRKAIPPSPPADCQLVLGGRTPRGPSVLWAMLCRAEDSGHRHHLRPALSTQLRTGPHCLSFQTF